MRSSRINFNRVCHECDVDRQRRPPPFSFVDSSSYLKYLAGAGGINGVWSVAYIKGHSRGGSAHFPQERTSRLNRARNFV